MQFSTKVISIWKYRNYFLSPLWFLKICCNYFTETPVNVDEAFCVQSVADQHHKYQHAFHWYLYGLKMLNHPELLLPLQGVTKKGLLEHLGLSARAFGSPSVALDFYHQLLDFSEFYSWSVKNCVTWVRVLNCVFNVSMTLIWDGVFIWSFKIISPNFHGTRILIINVLCDLFIFFIQCHVMGIQQIHGMSFLQLLTTWTYQNSRAWYIRIIYNVK